MNDRQSRGAPSRFTKTAQHISLPLLAAGLMHRPGRARNTNKPRAAQRAKRAELPFLFML